MSVRPVSGNRFAGAAGFTLAELMIVVAIIAMLLVGLLFSLMRQTDRAYDARRKGDLNMISRAFEEYYNDHGCYPPLTILDRCGSADLSPYLTTVPCDPRTNTPYNYMPIDSSNLCLGYRLFASLADTGDPAIMANGCSPTEGCGYGTQWNYGISTAGLLTAPGFTPSYKITPTPTVPTPTPTPMFPPGTYACDPSGTCNAYSNPTACSGPGDPCCPVSFADKVQCQTQCPILGPSYWCKQ
ncbi:type II secretion system GspH family protein [Patescibacteria group bacterium]|nr:type II secretion system GspH family protein [Patescibacteria group bacterium]